MTSGDLSPQQHETIVQQLAKLYELQELKEKNNDGSSPPKDEDGSQTRTVQPSSLQERSRHNDSRTSNVPPHVMSHSRSDGFNEPERPGFHERMPRGREMRPPHLLPTPYPPNDRGFPVPRGHPPRGYYRDHPHNRRGGFRPPRGGPDWMERGRGRCFDGPPRRRGRALPGPPPPPWHEPMEQNG